MASGYFVLLMTTLKQQKYQLKHIHATVVML